MACGKRVKVSYDGIVFGDFIADMLVEKFLLIENKAVQAIFPSHEVLLVNYLSATRIETGLLFDFGAASLQHKRKTRIY